MKQALDTRTKLLTKNPWPLMIELSIPAVLMPYIQLSSCNEGQEDLSLQCVGIAGSQCGIA